MPKKHVVASVSTKIPQKICDKKRKEKIKGCKKYLCFRPLLEFHAGCRWKIQLYCYYITVENYVAELGQAQVRVSELTGVPEACVIKNTSQVVVTEASDVLKMC